MTLITLQTLPQSISHLSSIIYRSADLISQNWPRGKSFKSFVNFLSNRAYLNPRGGLTPDPKSVSKSPSRFDFDGKPKANPMVQQLIDRQRNKMIDELERGRKGLQYPDPLLNVYGIKPNGDPTAMETPMRQIWGRRSREWWFFVWAKGLL